MVDGFALPTPHRAFLNNLFPDNFPRVYYIPCYDIEMTFLKKFHTTKSVNIEFNNTNIKKKTLITG